MKSNDVISSRHPWVQGHKAADDKPLITKELINDVIGKKGHRNANGRDPTENFLIINF